MTNGTFFMNPVQLGVFASRLSAVAAEMGVVLQRSAFSPNIRDRLDYSCAVFDSDGALCAQAAHIPVHLGSMAYAMDSIVKNVNWRVGDTLVLNDPFLGGTHLPDVTLISPVFVNERLQAFVANRAHHADIGSDQPGSMPISSSLGEEGLVISPQFLQRENRLEKEVWDSIRLALGAKTEEETDTLGDFKAQISANMKGLERLQFLISGMGEADFSAALADLNDYGEVVARQSLSDIPDGSYSAIDYMDDDGQGNQNLMLKAVIKVSSGDINVDFSGSHPQVPGNINCPLSVAAAATYYVFRCLMPDSTPACAGIFRPITIYAPKGSIVNAESPAAVAAGNVETSSRLVDLVIAALAKAIPEKMPAASQGTMNNLAMGGIRYKAGGDNDQNMSTWSYYETIAGGTGAHQSGRGLSAVQSHMTNTFNTPVEVLESNYPLRVVSYRLRDTSGGEGKNIGGEGIVREYEFLENAQATLLTERRSYAPYGAAGGEPGECGKNLLNGEMMPPKCALDLSPGDRLRIETPGGGGYGLASSDKTN